MVSRLPLASKGLAAFVHPYKTERMVLLTFSRNKLSVGLQPGQHCAHRCAHQIKPSRSDSKGRYAIKRQYHQAKENPAEAGFPWAILIAQ
jgi:hypothetical protein